MYYGKIIGGVLGLLVLGPIGLILGLFVGHLFDNGLMQTLKFASPQNIARIKHSFFETTFLLSGYLAKADGHISQQEVDHTEAVIAEDAEVVERFMNEIDSAILMHNASTQFADGGEFGMGAEIGIATGKMHARGPVGVEQLTSFKYVVRGDGQIRG